MRVPRLARRLALQEARRQPDGAGGFRESWEEVAVLWAEARALSGREHPGDEVNLARTSWRVTLRGAPAGSPLRPRPDQRLSDGVRVFTILAVAEADPAGRFLTCFCREEEPR